MKTTFLRKSRPYATCRVRVGFVLILGAVLLIAALGFWLPSFMPSTLYHIAAPFAHLRNWMEDRLAQAFVYFESKAGLAEENRVLSGELARQEAETILLRSLYPELESIQNMLSREENRKEILASVLLAPPLSPYDTLILDVGMEQDVSVGNLVRTQDGVALGRVTEVFRDFSRAVLLSAPGEKTPVRIGTSAALVEATGVGNGSFEVLLPREFPVAEGDPAVFPGFLPPIIGEVQSVSFEDVDFLQLVSFRSSVNMHTLRYVFVERSTSPSQDE